MRTWRHTLAQSTAGVAFGLLSWCVAHLATIAAYAHIHPGFVIHYHEWGGPLALAALALTITSVVTVGTALGSAHSPRSRRATVTTGALAPAVFVAVEFAEYLSGLHEAPPLALLVIGCLVHAGVGAMAPRLWSTLLEHAGTYLVTWSAGHGRRFALVAQAAVCAWAGTLGHAPWGSRAPPTGRDVLAPAV